MEDVGFSEGQAFAAVNKGSLTRVSGLPTPSPFTHPTKEAQG
jgi:hypothetical protein